MIQFENTLRTSVATINVVFFSLLSLPNVIADFSKESNFSFQDFTLAFTKKSLFRSKILILLLDFCYLRQFGNFSSLFLSVGSLFIALTRWMTNIKKDNIQKTSFIFS